MALRARRPRLPAGEDQATVSQATTHDPAICVHATSIALRPLQKVVWLLWRIVEAVLSFMDGILGVVPTKQARTLRPRARVEWTNSHYFSALTAIAWPALLRAVPFLLRKCLFPLRAMLKRAFPPIQAAAETNIPVRRSSCIDRGDSAMEAFPSGGNVSKRDRHGPPSPEAVPASSPVSGSVPPRSLEGLRCDSASRADGGTPAESPCASFSGATRESSDRVRCEPLPHGCWPANSPLSEINLPEPATGAIRLLRWEPKRSARWQARWGKLDPEAPGPLLNGKESARGRVLFADDDAINRMVRCISTRWQSRLNLCFSFS